jgi:hypothetical protein
MRLELNKALNMVIYQIHSLTNFEFDLDLASLGTGYFAVSFASMQHRKTAQKNYGISKMRLDQDQIVNMVIYSNFQILTNTISRELVSAVTGYCAVSFASVQHRKTDQTICRLSKMSLQQDQILNMVISNNFHIITNNKIALELVSAVTGYFAVSFATQNKLRVFNIEKQIRQSVGSPR